MQNSSQFTSIVAGSWHVIKRWTLTQGTRVATQGSTSGRQRGREAEGTGSLEFTAIDFALPLTCCLPGRVLSCLFLHLQWGKVAGLGGVWHPLHTVLVLSDSVFAERALTGVLRETHSAAITPQTQTCYSSPFLCSSKLIPRDAISYLGKLLRFFFPCYNRRKWFEVWQTVQILFSLITDCVLVLVPCLLTVWLEALARPQFLHPWNGYNNTYFIVSWVNSTNKVMLSDSAWNITYIIDFKNSSSFPTFSTLCCLLYLKIKG